MSERDRLIEAHYRKHQQDWVRSIQNGQINKHDAEDIVQTAYMRMLMYFDSYNGEPFDAWALTILRNCIKDSHRERALKGMTLEGPAESEAQAPETEQALVLDEIITFIDAIEKPNKKRIAQLFFVHGYSYDDIDAVMPEKKPAIRKIVQRLREELTAYVG